MDPETNFDFREENVDRIRDLLQYLKEETIEIATVSEVKIFDVFASVILEGLQYAQIIPQTLESELDDVAKEMGYCAGARKSLQKLLKIVLI